MTETLPPLVEAYLADLDRALAGTDPREHAETLAAVREHAAEAIALHGADDAAVAQVLAELGPVNAIAASATPLPAPAVPVPAPAPARDSQDGWLLGLSIAGLVGFFIPPLAIAALVWSIARLRAWTGNRGMQKVALGVAVASLAIFAVGVAGLLGFRNMSDCGQVYDVGAGLVTPIPCN